MSSTTVVTQLAPARTHAQRIAALQKANRIRSYRAEIKRQIIEGGKSVLDLRDDPRMASAKLVDFLLAEPGIGRVKAHRILQAAATSPSKTFGGVTDRQWVTITQIVTSRPQFHRYHPTTKRAAA